MAIGTRAELEAAIARFLVRDDQTTLTGDYIALAEASINRDIRHWRMETRVTLTANERFENVPTDWIETVRICLTDGAEIEMVGQSRMAKLRRGDEAGDPRYYAMSSGAFEFYPTPSASAIELIYLAKIDPLVDSTDTNWLLGSDPDVYLYGALMHSAGPLAEDARLALWGRLYADAVARVNAAGDKAVHSGPMRMRA